MKNLKTNFINTMLMNTINQVKNDNNMLTNTLNVK